MKGVRFVLGLAVIVLIALGFCVLASASEANAIRIHHDPHAFVVRQAVWMGGAIAIGFFATFFDYHLWKRWSWLTIGLYAVTVLLMAAVLLMPEVKGSHRWFKLGGVSFQPGEMAKIVTVLATAVFLSFRGWRMELFWKGTFPAAAIGGLLMALAVLEPDYGTTVIMGAACVMLLAIGGARFKHMAILGAAGATAVGIVLSFNANRMNRILSWLKGIVGMHAEGAVQLSQKEINAAHQLEQSLVAFQNGGLWGKGFTESMQKQYYLPEAHTDFIFSIGAEELGLIFSLAVLVLFLTVFICGMIIAYRSQDRLGRYIAAGASFLIFFQVLLNMGVVTGCLPTKGLALPFMSYGGTNLISAFVAIGFIFNVARQKHLQITTEKSIMSRRFFK